MDVPEIGVGELAARRADGVALIDVRTPAEYAEASVPGSDLMPLPDLVEHVDDVPTDGTVYVICATGVRSARATQYFLTQGIDAVNVAGGIQAWIDAGLPVDRAGDEAGGG